MRLVIFTSHYPFGNGEVFLENEIKVAEKYFDEIFIATYSKCTEGQLRYVPSNAKVILLRKNIKTFENIWFLVKGLFKPSSCKEVVSACRERGIRKLPMILQQIALNERHVSFIQIYEKDFLTDEITRSNTVYYSYWLNSAAVYLARNKNRLSGLCICRAHGGDCFFDRGYVPWRQLILTKLDGIFPISESGCSDILEHYGHIVPSLNNRVHLARLGVNVPTYICNDDNRSQSSIVVSCSNVIPLKRLDILVDALAECNSNNIHWVHFGDGVLLEQIKKRAGSILSNRSTITYEFRGRRPNSEIQDFYRANVIQLFINCSDVEGIPVSAMEAMSFGIPVVARDVGGNSELINNSCGILLPTNITPQELARAIDYLLNVDEDEYHHLRKSAREIIIKDFNNEKNYECYFRQIVRMVRNHGNR